MANEKPKLLGVQYLRAIAALMVAYFHLVGEVPAFTPALAFHDWMDSAHLSSGVYIFFIISGFIMYVTARNLPPSTFAYKRLVRILPLYWSVTLLLCVVALLDPNGVHRTDVTTGYLVKSLLFIPYANPTQQGLLFPLLVPGWSLNYEMVFYAVFAGALFTPARVRMWLVGGIISAAALCGAIYARPELLSIYGFYTSSHLILFAIGIALGAIYTRIHLPRWACGALLGVGVWILLSDFHVPEANRLAQFIGSVAIVAGAVIWEHRYGMPRWRPLLLLGDASYSIYLVHIFAFGLVRQAWKHVPMWSALAFAIVSMATAVAVALLTYRLVERPALRLFSRKPPASQLQLPTAPA